MLKIMNMAEYLASPAISKSGLDQINHSPAHYQAWLKHRPEPTKAMAFGSALHCALLEPDRFTSAYAEAPDCDKRTTKGKEAFAAWEQENQGKISLSKDDMEKLRNMQDAFFSHTLVSGALNNAFIERSVFWRDEATGVDCKARPDIVTDGLILDLKTTEDAGIKEFSRSAFNWRYHVQAAMYLAGASAALKQEFKEFVFIAIEKEPPFAIAVYRADPELLKRGRYEMQENLFTYAKCVINGSWPAYPDVVQTIQLPVWA